MSWIFCAIGSVNADESARFSQLHGEALFTFHDDGKYIAAGGLPETCHSSYEISAREGSEDGWVVAGTGLELVDRQVRLMNHDRWAGVVSSPDQFLRLNGHFMALSWRAGKFHCYTDNMGLRSAYVLRTPKHLFISSRLDWIARVAKTEIDLAAFGGFWLMINQVSYESLLKNVQRVSQGGRLCYHRGKLVITNTPWTPGRMPGADMSFRELLEAFMLPRSDAGYATSLGLSGGLDSRMLLAILIGSGNQDWRLHTIGEPMDTDIIISSAITADLKLPHIIFQDPMPGPQDCLAMLRSYVDQTIGTMPAATFLKLRYYSRLSAGRYIIIDGALGELGRRMLMNRVFYFHRKSAASRNMDAFYASLSVPRPGVFNPEALQRMRDGAVATLQPFYDAMPAIEEIGVENWLDLMVIRTLIPNRGSFEQTRSDAAAISYMPFGQPTLLQKVFDVPLAERRNSILFRRLIATHCSQLTGYPLAKAGLKYPYRTNTLTGALWRRIRSLTVGGFEDRTPVNLLNCLTEFVQDTAHSAYVRNCAWYDHTALLRHVSGFYAGDHSAAPLLNNWLSFELWRQSVAGR